MKLYRFTAPNTDIAMATVTEVLGGNALIYATRKIVNGVELLAGLNSDNTIEGIQEIKSHDVINSEETNIQKTSLEYEQLQEIKVQINEINSHLRSLAAMISMINQEYINQLNRKRFFGLNYLKQISFKKIFKLRMLKSESTR